MQNIEKQYATHREVRDELIEMQKCGGAMITPFALYKMFYWCSCDEENNQNERIKARSRAYFFCALCNEYWLFYCNAKHPKTEFFILDDRWEKYNISEKLMNDAIEFLQKINLIECGQKKLIYNNQVVTTYQIKSEMLQACSHRIKEKYDEERARRKPY